MQDLTLAFSFDPKEIHDELVGALNAGVTGYDLERGVEYEAETISGYVLVDHAYSSWKGGGSASWSSGRSPPGTSYGDCFGWMKLRAP